MPEHSGAHPPSERDTPRGDHRPPLDEEALAAAPWPVRVVPTTPSTNQLLAGEARAGAAPQVVVTDHQTGGRGRQGRGWETPPRAALTFSVLLRPAVDAAHWSWLPLLTGLAVTRALASLGVPAGVKWPNDVLLGEHKLAGILLELVPSPAGEAAVVGVGINVDQRDAELPAPTATSLRHAGYAVDRAPLLLAVLDELATVVSGWADAVGQDAGVGEWQRAVADACRTVGSRVHVELPGGELLQGRATGLDPAGRLLVEGEAGPRAVAAGDVVHVRGQGGDMI